MSPTGPTRVLVLAGTAEAGALVEVLAADPAFTVTASLAGRTRTPRRLPCPVRTGGFGGVEGLAAHLRREAVDVLVDATHPYAAVMPHHAVQAAELVGIRHVRLLRPPWDRPAGADWHEVADAPAAVQALEDLAARRVLLSIGRQLLPDFRGLHGVGVVLRTVDPPADLGLDVLAAVPLRPPLSLEGELAVLREHRLDAVVSRNAGGEATQAKIRAAILARVPLVVLRRPPPPEGTVIPDVAGVHRLLTRVARRSDQPGRS